MDIPEDSQCRPLLDAYPGLKSIPWMPLMDGLPTPVQHLENISRRHEGWEIYIKRDDTCSSIYGGNKPRKFEFFFADAIKKGKKKIVTGGGTATNHGLATALFCQELDLGCKLYLNEQPLTIAVQHKLLAYLNLKAELATFSGYGMLVLHGLKELLFHRGNYLMLPGGSPVFGLGSPRGCVGFVNAAFELKQQVDSGGVPEPDYIFIPAGSTGSAAGLVLGCKLAGLSSKVVPVQVSAKFIANPKTIEKNAKLALKFLRRHDPSIPEVEPTYLRDFLFEGGFLGSEYGRVTRSGQDAIDLVARLEGNMGFHLESTYSGKAFAAMQDFMEREDHAAGGTALFWLTYNSVDLSGLVRASNFKYDRLPKHFHKYFETPLSCWRVLDCDGQKREKCIAYLNDENRCWVVKELAGKDTAGCEECPAKKEILENMAIQEDA